MLPEVDRWLAGLTSPERLDATVTDILEADRQQFDEPPELRRARRQAAEARKRLDQYLAALDAGMDPGLLTERTRTAQAELATAKAVIDTYGASGPQELTGEQVYGLLESVGGLTVLLAEADTKIRQRVYRSAGVHLRYQRTEKGEKITACLRVGLSRVGGGT